MKGLLGFPPQDTTSDWLAARLEWPALAFSFVLALVTGILFGLVPALEAARERAGAIMKDQASSLASSSRQARLRQSFIVAQVALSLVLLVGAGLFTRSLYRLMTVDPGFHTENLMRFSLQPSLNGYDLAGGLAFYRDVQERLASLPGVRSVGATNNGPFGHGRRTGLITLEGYKAGDDGNIRVWEDGASPNYFRTMGIPIIAGREFEDRDQAGPQRVVVINEAFARRFGSMGNLLGKHMAFSVGDVVPDYEIIGIVRDTKYLSLRDEPQPFVWKALAQEGQRDSATFYVRAWRDESGLGRDVRRLIRGLDADLPVYEMQSMTVQIADSIHRDRLVAILASAFGALATLLAAIGLYGVVAFNVARRTAEMGVRMALGAMPGDVLALVMREVGWLVVAGAASGLVAAWMLGRYVQSQLYAVAANDTVVFAGALLVLAVAAMTAGYIPARRAARIDPTVALRYE